MSDISQWSSTPASNNSAPPDGFPEGQAPSTVNDSARELMSSVKDWYADLNATLASTGSANAYVLATNQTHAALADQSLLVFRANFANTGAATLAVDGLAAKAIKKNHDQALVSGDIEANQVVVVAYNSTDDTYELISSVGLNIQALVIAASDENSAISAGTAKITFRMPYAFTLLAGNAGVKASLTTAASTGTFTVDINEGGTTILSTKLTIDATETTSLDAATEVVISDTALAKDAVITIDVDDAGAGDATGLKVTFIGVYG